MADWKWLTALVFALAGAVALGRLVHPYIGSGNTCEGIGFGCSPERLVDGFVIMAVFAVLAVASLLVAWRRARRGRRWRTALVAGIAITVLASSATVWSQLPRHHISPGPLSAALEQWERVLADGEAVAPAGTALGDVLRGVPRSGPITCRDQYDRSTGAREYRWSNRDESGVQRGSSNTPVAVTSAAIGSWADRLHERGVGATVADPTGDPTSDRRFQVGSYGQVGASDSPAGGVLYLRASFYISELEITASTGCHRD